MTFKESNVNNDLEKGILKMQDQEIDRTGNLKKKGAKTDLRPSDSFESSLNTEQNTYV